MSAVDATMIASPEPAMVETHHRHYSSSDDVSVDIHNITSTGNDDDDGEVPDPSYSSASFSEEDDDDDDECCSISSTLDIPDDYICPLTLEMFIYPVMDRYGNNYERSAIMTWFANGNTTCPLTRRELKPSDLVTNSNLKSQIDEFRKEQLKQTCLPDNNNDIRPSEHYEQLLGVITMALDQDEDDDDDDEEEGGGTTHATATASPTTTTTITPEDVERARVVALERERRRRRQRVVNAARAAASSMYTTTNAPPRFSYSSSSTSRSSSPAYNEDMDDYNDDEEYHPSSDDYRIHDENISFQNLRNYRIPIDQLSSQQLRLLHSLIRLPYYEIPETQQQQHRQQRSNGTGNHSSSNTNSNDIASPRRQQRIRIMSKFWKKIISSSN